MIPAVMVVVVFLAGGTLMHAADADGDGVDDMDDADPANAGVDWLPTPEKSFQWIEINDAPPGYEAVDMNSHGHVLFRRLDYGVAVWPDILQSSPVGVICKPSVTGAGRWTNVFFKPALFSLRCFNVKTDTVSLISIPLPLKAATPGIYDDSHALSYVNVAALGDDGGVMANVSYKYQYFDGHPEDQVWASPNHNTYVFNWNPEDYEECYLLGPDRGYTGADESVSTCNWVAGYQTLPGSGPSDPPVVSALVLDQAKPSNQLITTSVALVKFPPAPAAPISYVMQEDRSSGLDFTNYNPYLPYAQFTNLGRTVLWKAYNASGVYTIAFPGVDDYVEFEGSFWSVFEIPDSSVGVGRWGMTINNQNFLWGETPVSMGITGVLQFDRLGTGIGDRGSSRDIWRNGTWRTLGASTSNASSLPSGLVLRKIGQSGIIWAGIGGTEGILVPNP